MMLRVNQEAVDFAERMIGEGDYRINTVWRNVQPSEAARRRFLEEHGWDAYAQWFLAEDTGEPEGSAERLKFPIGDFKSVHRSGLTAAKDEAVRQRSLELEAAANELIFFFDRITAC